MKKLILSLAFTFLSLIMFAQTGKTVHVKAYTKKNGTHVESYNRSAPHSKGSSTTKSHSSKRK